MIKIVQFGEGNFLRAFADLYLETVRREGTDLSVDIVKPIPGPLPEGFREAGNRYHVVLRGHAEGADVEDAYDVSVVDRVVDPFVQQDVYLSLARDPELAVIISNTTEAGICYSASDKREDFATATYPAKLTGFLWERYCAGLPGVYILPVELIESNADELARCVDAYCELWDLPHDFRAWNKSQNVYCNTLVDRIVSGHPRDAETREHLFRLIGERDPLLTVAEPFGLWVIENKGDIATILPAGEHNIEVIFTEDIGYYKRRKVRLLNGSHTNLVPAGLILGKETVYDCMTDERLHAFFTATLAEIIPYVSDQVETTRRFAADVEERFFNPFLNHRLSSIALNSISKWRARDLPTFRDYYEREGHIPPHMTMGFAYLMYLYMTRHAGLVDDPAYLAHFAAGGSAVDFMQNTAAWGEDLTAYTGFAEAVEDAITRIAAGEVLL